MEATKTQISLSIKGFIGSYNGKVQAGGGWISGMA